MSETFGRAYLSRKEAATYLTTKYFPISAATLARYAMQNLGPETRTRPGGGQCLYPQEALDKWAQNFPKTKPRGGALSGARR